MRIPESWDDKNVLQDEPFLSAFPVWNSETPGPRRIQFGPIINKLKAEKDCGRVLTTWLKHAFPLPELKKPDHESYDTLQFFVQIYWWLHTNEDMEALLHLERQYYRLGLSHHFAKVRIVLAKLTPSCEKQLHRPDDPSSFPRKVPGRGKNKLRTELVIPPKSPIQSVPSIPTTKKIDSSTSHVGSKPSYAKLHFKKKVKTEDSEPTIVPTSEMSPNISLETPSLLPVNSNYDGSAESIPSTAMEISSVVPVKRPSTSSDNRKLKRRAITSMPNSIDTEVKGSATSRTGIANTVMRRGRGRPRKTADPTSVNGQNKQSPITPIAPREENRHESTRIDISISVKAHKVDLPHSGAQSKNHPHLTEVVGKKIINIRKPETITASKCVNANTVIKSSLDRCREDLGYVSTSDLATGTRMSVETPGVDVSRSEMDAQPKKNASPTEAATNGNSLHKRHICSSEPVLSSPGQIHLYQNEGLQMTLVDELCKQEPEWVQSLLPNSPLVGPYLPKPPLQFFPPIWAESRQEVCESFDWFRSYQGGVYHVHNAAKGYLLGAFPSSRDKFEHGGKLIISHGGGKAESLHSLKGNISCQPASDQLAQDKSVRALYDNYLHNRPLALVMDDKYALFPFDLRAKGVAYAVLGFYTIAYAWAEYQQSNNESGRVVRYKFAFRWCEHQGPPWWNQGLEDEECDSHFRFNFEPDLSTESKISTSTITSSQTHAPYNMDLNGEFLAKKYWQDCLRTPQDLSKLEIAAIIEKRKLSVVCETCKELSLRVFALSWACLNPVCQQFWRQAHGQYLPFHLDYHPSFLELPPSRPIPIGFGRLEPPHPVDFLNGDSITTYASTRGFRCNDCGRLSCRYKWENWECMNCGSVMTIPYSIRDANDLLHQKVSTDFKDYSINVISGITQSPPTSFLHERGRGILHTFILPHDRARIHHIQSGNSLGRQEANLIFRDYQIQAADGSLKFRRWPMRAHKCRGALLTNYFSQNSGEPYKYVGGDANTVPFDRAPTAVVNARSLIQKRIKQALGISAEFNEVLSAAYMERQKMAFHSDNEVGLGPLVAGLSLGSPALMHFRLHSKHDPERERRGILLSVVLRHGDVLVMDGAGVQEFYEHTVVPENFRIAATARQINSGHT